MKKHKIKALDGYIYIEDFDGKNNEETDRAKIYDENMAYIDYISLEDLSKNKYNQIITSIINVRDFEDFAERFAYSYDYSESLEYLLDSIFDNGDTTQEEFDELEDCLNTMSEDEIMTKYSINKVGKYYFYIHE